MDSKLKCFRCGVWPCECHDGVSLIHGCSLEVMPHLRDYGVDHILTDPPYNVGHAYDEHDDRMNEQLYLSRLRDVFIESSLCGADNIMWFWQGIRVANGEARACLPPDWRIHHLGAWFKREFAGDLWKGGHPAYSWEPIIWATRQEKVEFAGPRGGHNGRDCLVGNSSRHDHDAIGHPCPKTFSIVKTVLAWIKGDCVLDPYAGAGTTLRAAKDLGRRAIGIEKSAAYCRLIDRRLKQEILNFQD